MKCVEESNDYNYLKKVFCRKSVRMERLRDREKNASNGQYEVLEEQKWAELKASLEQEEGPSL